MTTEQKQDIVRRALTFMDQCAGEGICFANLDQSHDPAIILCDMTNLLGMDDWPPAIETFVKMIK